MYHLFRQISISVVLFQTVQIQSTRRIWNSIRFSGASESKTSDEVFTTLFNINGASSEVRTRGYEGSVHAEIFSTDVIEKATFDYVGSGVVSTLSGGAIASTAFDLTEFYLISVELLPRSLLLIHQILQQTPAFLEKPQSNSFHHTLVLELFLLMQSM